MKTDLQIHPAACPSSNEEGSPTCGGAFSFLSICSGIEAASVAWNPLGWKAIGFSEIEPFPCAVLKHHYPHVPNFGDMTKYHEWPDTLRPDLIAGGTPCQAFSVAGLRKGLEDPRGNLTLVFLGILARYRPRWVVWENVPGVLSDATGAFGAFLGGLGELGYGFAYRVLDAQYFGVPQRRRRVFVVGYLGDWRRAAAVLFERESLLRNPPPSRESGEGASPCLRARANSSHRTDSEAFVAVAPTLNAHFGEKQGLENQHIDGGGGLFVSHTLRGEGYDASEDGTGRGTPLTVVHGTQDPCTDHHLAFSLGRNSGQENAIAFAQNQMGEVRTGDVLGTLNTNSNASGRNTPMIAGPAVRRLTPRECERLQDFPDDYTAIPWRGKPADQCPDGPRYKALGNSWATCVPRWIGERIQEADKL